MIKLNINYMKLKDLQDRIIIDIEYYLVVLMNMYGNFLCEI